MKLLYGRKGMYGKGKSSIMLRLLLFLLPLGFDTLGVALSLGMKGFYAKPSPRPMLLPFWLRSALLFAGAEMLMPLVGLTIGYGLSSMVSELMGIIGPVLLIGVGLWELAGEIRELLEKRRKPIQTASPDQSVQTKPAPQLAPSLLTAWTKSLLLVLSISLDELVVGFSLGSITSKTADQGSNLSVLIICALIGLQAILMTITGLTLGRLLRGSAKALKQCGEWIGALLLIGLGAWLLLPAN
jgi:putative Mn2+ efflux pump MntP